MTTEATQKNFFLKIHLSEDSEKWSKTAPKFVDLELDEKLSSKTKNFWHFSHEKP